MITKDLSTLTIHRLTQNQYDSVLESGNIDESALYLTPDEDDVPISGSDISAIMEEVNKKADKEHNHDDSYYTEVEIDEMFNGINNAINGKADSKHTHDEINGFQVKLDEKVSITRSINGKPLSDDIVLSASDVGADSIGSASGALEEAKLYAKELSDNKADLEHDHNDFYYTETEVDEKVLIINNSIEDIIDGATVVAKANHAINSDNATDAINAIKATQDASGNIITETYETKVDAASKLNEAKSYADGIKNDLLNGAGEAYNTLKELGDLIDDNTDAIDALEIVAAGKQDKITGTAGQFVVIGSDGKVTTKTVYNFEEASF